MHYCWQGADIRQLENNLVEDTRDSCSQCDPWLCAMVKDRSTPALACSAKQLSFTIDVKVRWN